MKILLVLLDEDAASAPTGNKAELLYNDESVVPHSGPSFVTLFRCVMWKLYMCMYVYVCTHTLLIIRNLYL